MEVLIILKKETNSIIKRFNDLKKYFLSNYPIEPKYYYEDNIDLKNISKKKFYIISSNVFPLLSSVNLKTIFLYDRSSLIEVNSHQIAYLSLKRAVNSKKNIPDSVPYDYIYEILRNLKYQNYRSLNKFSEDDLYSKLWYYIDDDNISIFLRFMENVYFTWRFMNMMKLKLADRYSNIVYYDGKNKLESKKLVEKMGIRVPKTYDVYDSLDDIKIINYPICIIKPTNLDGGKMVIRVNNDKNLDYIKNKLKDYDKVNESKELMPLINLRFHPKILVEEYIVDMNGGYSFPCELKFYVFNGKILFFLGINREIDYNKFDFFDENFNKIDNSKLSFKSTELGYDWIKFDYFNKLKGDVLRIYNKFNKDLLDSFIGKFIRIDFFVTKDNYYFGEFALFPNGGEGNNLSSFGKKYFIKHWFPEVYSIFN